MMHAKTLASVGAIATLFLPAASFALDDFDDEVSASVMTEADFLNSFIVPLNAEGDATFDLSAFHSHPCFDAVGEEREWCLKLLGVSGDYDSTIDAQAFESLILRHALNMRCDGLSGAMLVECHASNEAALPPLLSQFNLHFGSGVVLSDTDEDVPDDEGDERSHVRMRSQHLWNLCANDDASQSACYQNHIRLVTGSEMTIADIDDLFNRPGDDDAPVNDDVGDDADDDADDDNDVNDDGKDDVRSETDEDTVGMTMHERARRLWSICADSTQGQDRCYRSHYRTAVDETTDMNALEEDIRR